MKLVWHDDEKMFTCFGTLDQHQQQLDWWENTPDDCCLCIDNWSPFFNNKVLWHVWDEFDNMDNLMLFKLTWGGA